jgi:nucleotide-binding universal stress UspA family protein
MPYRKILLATDGSEQSMRAATQAASLAKVTGADVEILAVAVLQPLYGGLQLGAIGPDCIEGDAERAAELAVTDTATVVRKASVEPKTVVVIAMGNAAAAIVEEAKSIGADLIVMGSRGLGRAGTLVLGSTSVQVLHITEVPVLIVR